MYESYEKILSSRFLELTPCVCGQDYVWVNQDNLTDRVEIKARILINAKFLCSFVL